MYSVDMSGSLSCQSNYRITGIKRQRLFDVTWTTHPQYAVILSYLTKVTAAPSAKLAHFSSKIRVSVLPRKYDESLISSCIRHLKHLLEVLNKETSPVLKNECRMDYFISIIHLSITLPVYGVGIISYMY